MPRDILYCRLSALSGIFQPNFQYYVHYFSLSNLTRQRKTEMMWNILKHDMFSSAVTAYYHWLFNFKLHLPLAFLTLYAHWAARVAFTESALAPPSRCRGFSRVLPLQQNLKEFWGLTMSIKIALYSSWNKLSIGWYFEYGFHMKISRKTWLESCPRVFERNSIMAEITSESESYLSRMKMIQTQFLYCFC